MLYSWGLGCAGVRPLLCGVSIRPTRVTVLKKWCKMSEKNLEKRLRYDLLAPVYGWFSEGFDTADLQDARALLGA